MCIKKTNAKCDAFHHTLEEINCVSSDDCAVAAEVWFDLLCVFHHCSVFLMKHI